MGSKNAEPHVKELATVLTGRRDDVQFEMRVKVDGKSLEVYEDAEMEGGGSEAWIASQNGKVCLSGTSSYRHLSPPMRPRSLIPHLYSP
jgi:hypothetical protein